MPQIVRVEVRNTGRFAGAGHDVLGHVGQEADEDPPLGSAIVRRTSLRDFVNEPLRDGHPATSRGCFPLTDAEAALG
jgi:hypothetical protein